MFGLTVLLLAAQQEVSRRRNDSLIKSVQAVLVEGISPRDAAKMIGRTETNLICVFPAPERPDLHVGRMQSLRITHATLLTLFGEPLEAGKERDAI
jgi:tRNA A37 methylthiotransferase MiaB